MKVKAQAGPEPNSPKTVVADRDPVDLARLLADPPNYNLLASTIDYVVNVNVFGRGWDSYNIDNLAFLAAGIDSSQYAVSEMSKAARFPNSRALHDFVCGHTPPSGLILEFGVFSGQSINHLAAQFPGRRLFGFDSFEGLPETWRPGYEKGSFSTNLPTVRDNVELVVGWFDRTLPDFVKTVPFEPLALLHVDCDLYSSTKTIFDFLSVRIVPGTIILFDEYFNYPGWRLHEYKAFQELISYKKLKYEYIGVVPNHQQVAVTITSVG